MGTKARNKNIDCFKAVLIILVVLRHVLQFSTSDEGGILTNYIWTIQMPGFMLISGYFGFKSVSSMRLCFERVKKNAVRYVLPFLTWFFLIKVLLQRFCDGNLIQAGFDLVFHVDHGLWYLWIIFVLALIALLANLCFTRLEGRGFHKAVLSVAFIWAVSLVFLFVAGKPSGLSFAGIKTVLYYSPFYIAGYFLRIGKEYKDLSWNDIVGNWGAAVSLVLYIVVVYYFDFYREESSLVMQAARLIGGISGNVLLYTLVREAQGVLAHLKFDKLGALTLEVYATHLAVVTLMASDCGYAFFSVHGFVNATISLFLTTLFTGLIIFTFRQIPLFNFLMYGVKPLKSK